MNDKIFKNAVLNGLVNSNFLGNEQIAPDLVTNTADNNIWMTLKHELLNCRSFTWTVGFITLDILIPFKVVMADLDKKGISGTLITSTYLNFNDPKVFLELQKIPNLKVKIADAAGFHIKGYFFEYPSYQTMIVGSANFTRSALIKNYELSIKISSKNNATLTEKFRDQIHLLNDHSVVLTKNWIENYQKTWVKPVKFSENNLNGKSKKIIPNQMQIKALQELSVLRKNRQTKALVISATGTGKTYLGAFAVKQAKTKRFLYLIHRKQISKKTLESFYQVIGGDKSDYGLFSGSNHDLNKKYLFATVQTMSQQVRLDQIDSDYFDYILIDEAHHVASPSYQRILNKFKPKFLLGMTATPERMDNQDVYKNFDYNLAYEIRLRSALEEKMLTPFHYVGIQDYEWNGITIDETSNLRYLANENRIDYILDELEYYGYSGKQAKGLVFCSRQDEAHELAKLFTQKGYKAKALTNQDNEATRNQVVEELESGIIKYIFTVDLFNEGIDIPSLNQIVMLRNTQSSIIFVQQLGRGLRKYPTKEYTLVIDFIGNYKNNYLVPIAINNDNSRDIDQVRREVKNPNFIDVSTINFSKVASEKILISLDRIKLDGLKELRNSYQDLKNKIGRVPLLQDFYNYGSVSPEVFANNSALKNYSDFLLKMDEDIRLSDYENRVLTFVTKELLNGKRPHELILLNLLLHKNIVSKNKYLEELRLSNAYIDNAVLSSVIQILSLEFFDIKKGKSTKKAQYGNTSLLNQENSDSYRLNAKVLDILNESSWFKKLFQDAVITGLKINKKYQNSEQFTLYRQYNRKDACRLLNWPKDVSAPMYGYRVGDDACPIFITYKKDDNKKRNSIYKNSLENGYNLHWYTRSPRHVDSEEVQKLLSGIKLHLFVKESDAASKEFYYLGEAEIQKESVKEELIGPKHKSTVGMNLLLKHPLETKIKSILFDN